MEFSDDDMLREFIVRRPANEERHRRVDPTLDAADRAKHLTRPIHKATVIKVAVRTVIVAKRNWLTRQRSVSSVIRAFGVHVEGGQEEQDSNAQSSGNNHKVASKRRRQIARIDKNMVCLQATDSSEEVVRENNIPNDTPSFTTQQESDNTLANHIDTPKQEVKDANGDNDNT